MKYQDTFVTAKGEKRAFVILTELNTLWFNTGTLCNLACNNCYIESSPKNDRLQYLTLESIHPFLKNFKGKIGLTGGEPFLNPHIIPILKACLEVSTEVLVLTNAFNVLRKHKANLIEINERFPHLKIRVSLDHFTKGGHEKMRGAHTFDKTLLEIKWLFENGFEISLAGRALSGETTEIALKGYQNLLSEFEIPWKLNLSKLVLFPEMDLEVDVPEISVHCWDKLKKNPKDMMCASERMVVHHKGQDHPFVMPCTLLAYDTQFILGKDLNTAKNQVHLNHPFCAQFCVLGGSKCSGPS